MIALYPRVSTQEQAREGFSIEEQIERLKNYCKAMGWESFKFYTDAGYSGGNMNRPALQEMIKDVEAGKIEKVVVYKLDRLSRSQKDTLNLIEDVFLANGVDFVSMSENFDTSTPFGRAMVGILAVFAQLEREQIKERMSMGREGRAKLGKWHGGGWDPIGYDYIDGELVINEYEAMQVRELFDMFLSGYSYKAIERIFDEKGYQYKYGKWYTTRIVRVLTNDLYIGYITHEGSRHKGSHTPIIDNETFEKVQALVKRKKEAYTVNTTQKSTYLGGMLKCKHCGGKYAVNPICRDKYRYNYYTCYSRRKQNKRMIIDPNCKNKNWRTEKLDSVIFEEIKKLQTDPDYIVNIQNERFALNENNKKIEILKSEIAKLDVQRSRFMDLYGLGEFSVEELQEKVTPLNEQKERLQAELETLTSFKPDLDVEEVREIVKNFSDILDRGVFEEIRLVIESLIEYIEIDNEDIIIHWRFI